MNSEMGFCKYKDILGKPNEGVHKYKIFGISIVDTVLTLIVALFIGIIVGILNANYSYIFYYSIISFIILLVLGELLHYLFCVKTTVIKKILNE